MSPALKELHALALRQFERELPPEAIAVIHGAARIAKAAGQLPAAAGEQLEDGCLRTWFDLWRFGESLEGIDQ